ncbi:MAG: phosphatidylserine decarboxylase family protein [Desulfatiglandales bacterium]|nr:phosphatidylserine decarboxylase family protein [Desulfatiglandales bacterium]
MPASNFGNTRIKNRLPVAKEGLPFIFTSIGLTLLFLWMSFLILSIITVILSLFIIYFFRDPERENAVDDITVLTPADGKIIDIQHIKDGNNPLGGPAAKVSIFMSVFNVHVNRVPVSGRISKITYHPGNFFSANLDKASEKNENNRITLQTADGRKIVFIQIAGLIARRIVCWIKEEDDVKIGQRFGLIRFGSRLDIYLPGNSRIAVQLRHKVKAGKTILGYLS